MLAELGQFAIAIALVVAITQAIVPLIGAARADYQQMLYASYAAFAQFAFLAAAFVLLAVSFVHSDFSLFVVASNSNTAMPFFFRLAATWGNHEGSLLLWVTILALFGLAIAAFGRNLPTTLKARVLAIQAAISSGFLILMIFTSNPFARLHPVPTDGQELNPLLQDIGLVLHPPFLYLGYVGFSVAFSFAVAALIEGRVDAVWARFLRPWVLAAWIFLTIGITLGSFWAYYELGWGGWWFWDPVENASFMPWLAGTALLHSAIVVERRQTLVVWTLLLAILTFSLSLVGTFLVRSGIITSVHAFAVDPARGVGILALIALATGGSLTLFSLRARNLDRLVPFRMVSREAGLVLNNILLVVATGTVFLGTFYPLFVELLSDEKISVGAPFYDRSFVPVMIPLLLAVAVGSSLRWKRDQLGQAIMRLKWPLVLAAICAIAFFLFGGLTALGAAAGIFLSAWLILGSGAILTKRLRLQDRNVSRSWRALVTTPLATYGMIFAHIGLGLFVGGVTAVTAFEQERIVALAPGESVEIAHLDVTLEDVSGGARDNFQFERGHFTVSRSGEPIMNLTSERRFYPVSGRVTTEAAIRPRGLTNIYVAIGEPNDAGEWVARVYYHPFVLLIWLGPILMALGGAFSLADRRMRVGAPASKPIPAMALEA